MEISQDFSYPPCVDVQVEGGGVDQVQVEYEWRSGLCKECMEFGHDLGRCPRRLRKMREKEIPPKKGEQLQVVTRRRDSQARRSKGVKNTQKERRH